MILESDFFIYQNNIKLENSKYDFIFKLGKYYITPHTPFTDFTTVSFFIKTDTAISSIIYVYYSLADIINPNNYKSSYIFLTSIIPKEITSGAFKFQVLTFNGLTPTSNLVDMSICNGISSDLSYITFVDTINNYNNYNITLYDSNGSTVPDGKYIVKCYINK